MCGFLGFISERNYESLLVDSLDVIKHRGPDKQLSLVQRSESYYVGLGHARLSIIDLSDEASQPFISKCGRYNLVFNGEIYNYKELRVELLALGFDFTTDSDTEVLLNAWIAWGLEALPKFIGMFSFVIFDKAAKKIVLVRDAFGIKPFFYTLPQDKRVFFGSDIRGLIKLRNTTFEPNLQRAYDYLVHGDYDSTESTFVEGVKHIMPGHYLEFSLITGNMTEPKAWWQPDLSYTSTLSFDEAKDKLRTLFLDSVKLHLRSDVPLGVALSGGVDSSAVVCAVRHLEPNTPIHTFSYIASDNRISEEVWVDLINKDIKAIEHKVVSNSAEMQKDLDNMLLMQGEPFGGTSIYAQYRVFKLAKESGITVTLDGQGADELLAGYNGYPGRRLLSILETGNFIKAKYFAKHWATFPGRSYLTPWKNLASLKLPNLLYKVAKKTTGRDSYTSGLNIDYLINKGVNFEVDRSILSKKNKGKRVREALAESIESKGLPSLLRHGDRNSMAFSIESRVPFLTLPMAEFLLSLPENYLISNKGVTKHIFREAMRGIVPDSHLDRKDKIGFETPEAEWLLSMSGAIETWINDAPEIPFINKAEVLEGFKQVILGERSFDSRVWRWVNYIRWYTLMEIATLN
ncbi:asparagine synthase (glutamine-hydrolyzing) [Psychrobacter cryohalolentis]|uniref:asparagine synthase (glutamine-hydrolyzing) n=1 Tax=Psychrobacter cryohalolentis (strain ATCC BAA-1226 / DSM 17306 / VKM B-2378 / K5) TaxID=335284 RepID=Q1QD48_PSYCK|nr:asparagine synthase (glutamine-hydrolyzing) [Psychrobacter cryohalolentis]ABE74405.1 Asparagine synthase, glutamine-hydrolyzing [Psychrobacter cryohalolentis K5]ASE27033.1 asparagine synthase (glutamine-hydrolyzing) [Psychrobacter cryohalolentis]